MIELPVAGRASAAGASAAEPAEAAASTAAAVSAESAAGPASAPSAATPHQVTENHAGEEAGSAAAPAATTDHAAEQQQHNQSDDDRWKRDASAGSGDAAAGTRRLAFNCDSLGLGDPGAELLGRGEQRTAVISLAQNGPDAAQNAAGVTVGDDRLKTVADFGALFAVLHGKQQHQAVVLALLADAPLAEQRVGDVFDGLAIERIQQHDGHLHAGG